MSNLKLIVAALTLTSFGLLTACNDGFKGAALSTGVTKPRVVKGEGDLDAPKTSQEEQEEAIEEIELEFKVTDPSYSEEMDDYFQAFSIVRVDSRDGSTSMDAVIVAGCGADQKFRTSAVVDMSILRDKETMTLGLANGYEILVRCTDEYCDEMIASVYRANPRRADSFGRIDFLMIGYRANGSNSFANITEYVSGYEHGRTGLSQKSSVAYYEQTECGVEPPDDGLDDMFGPLSSPSTPTYPYEDVDGDGPF